MTLKPGLGSLKVIENYPIQSGTHDFLLTFHSNHRPISHRFRDKRRWMSKIAQKSPIFPPSVYLTPPMKGLPLEFGIGVRGPECFYDGAIRGRKSFQIRLVVLIQYRLWQTPTQPPSHVAVAITLNALAKASSLKTACWFVGGDDLTGALHVLQLPLLLLTTSITLSSNKVQNGDILVPANPGPPGKMAVKTEREIYIYRCTLYSTLDSFYIINILTT